MPRKSNGRQVRGPSQPVRAAMAALEARLSVMEQAFNTNTRVFSEGVQMLEAQQEVARRVMGQLEAGDPIRTTAPGRIDWNSYLKEYIQELADAEEKSLLETNREQKGHIASVDDDSPIIFGGDTQ